MNFLKAGIGGAGLALGLSGASAFSLIRTVPAKKLMMGMKTSPLWQAPSRDYDSPMQKACYVVVLDLHTMDKRISRLFKDWTDYSSNLVEGELVKKDGANALLPPTDTGETVGLNPYRLSLTFGVSATFLKKLGLEAKRPKLFRDCLHFKGVIAGQIYGWRYRHSGLCRRNEQVAFHAVRNLIRKGRNTITTKC